MYVKPLAILLLLSGLIFGIWKFWDYAGDVREDRIVREFKEKELALISENLKLRQKAEEKRIEREIVYRDKIKTVYQIRDNCLDTVMPAELLQSFCEVGLSKDLCQPSVTR